MAMRSRRSLKRALQLESLEHRRMFVVEVAIQPPVVSAFATFAEVRGLKSELSTQPVVTQTIDNAGVRQAVKEIDGVLYAFQGSSVFTTNIATGVTQTRTLTALQGSTGIQVRDVAKVNGNIVYVGGSLTGNAAPTKSSIPTMWDAAGNATRIGPAGKTGIANFVSDDGLIGGFYENVSNQYSPWVHSALGDFDLPVTSTSTNPRAAVGFASGGSYLIGYDDNTPVIWQTTHAPEQGDYELLYSANQSLDYPVGATLGAAGKNFKILEDESGSINIFGQFDIPVFVQGNVTGFESHAAVWSIQGTLLHDFGPNTEMLGVQAVGTSYVVAHRNSISLINLINQTDVTTVTLDSLIGQPVAGTTRKILSDAVFRVNSATEVVVGVNYSESSLTLTRSKVALVTLKTPDLLQLDLDNDGVFDETFFGAEMFAPPFTPLGYGQKTLAARVTYDDNTTANAVTTYESLRYDVESNGVITELRVGGTAAVDSATVTLIGDRSYRVSLAGQTRDFQNVDRVAVRLSTGNDTLVLAGGIELDLVNLAEIETIDTTADTVETLKNIQTLFVENQVGPTGTLLIKAGLEDTLNLIKTGWTVEEPQLIDGRATAKLTSDGKTLLLQTGSFYNPINPLDTTFDTVVSPRDALLVINYLNQRSEGLTPTIDAYLDVNNNGVVTALDVLIIINELNTRGAGEGEAVQTASMGDLASSWAMPFDIDEQVSLRRRRF